MRGNVMAIRILTDFFTKIPHWYIFDHKKIVVLIRHSSSFFFSFRSASGNSCNHISKREKNITIVMRVHFIRVHKEWIYENSDHHGIYFFWFILSFYCFVFSVLLIWRRNLLWPVHVFWTETEYLEPCKRFGDREI